MFLETRDTGKELSDECVILTLTPPKGADLG